jgi:hypothetical protein
MIFTCFAPRRSSSRAALRTAGTPSATCAKPLVCTWQAQISGVSVRSRKSPCPPVWLSTRPEWNMRGPSTSPRSTASASPQSQPPASRTVVKPRRNMRSRITRASCAISVVGFFSIAPMSTDVIVTCTCASIRPGITVRPPTRITARAVEAHGAFGDFANAIAFDDDALVLGDDAALDVEHGSFFEDDERHFASGCGDAAQSETCGSPSASATHVTLRDTQKQLLS